MRSLTWIGVVVLVLILLAWINGWNTSGIARISREIGFLLGLLIGFAVARPLLPSRVPPTDLLILLGATIGGGLIGAAVLGTAGLSLARGVHRVELGPLDQLLGAMLSSVSTIAICAIVLHVLAILDAKSPPVRAAQHDLVVHWLIHNPTATWL